MKVFFILFSFWIAVSLSAETHVVVQADKVFLRDLPQEKIAEMIENPLIEREYKLKELNLKKGDTLLFKNRDEVKHNVSGFIEEANIFNVEIQEPGDKNDKEIKLDKEGEYRIQCAIHPKMILKVNVK